MNDAIVRVSLAAVVLAFASPAAAEELLPPDRPVAEVIDHYVGQKLAEAKVTPAPQADDATLVRRLTLDLAGRIPSVAEAKAYVESNDPHKRAQLVDRLLASPEYVAHSATEFDILLRAGNDQAPSVRPYLLAAFKENRPWDRMFRELMGVSPDPTRPEKYVLGRLRDTDGLTRDVSSTFFGLNLSCAQCHRHPYVKDLTQAYYFGLKAFFSRSYEFHGELLERQYGTRSQYKTRNGALREVGLLFLTGAAVEEPKPDTDDLTRAIQEESQRIEGFRKDFARTKQMPPRPAFSYRARLVEVALRPENRDRFARSIVNRLWFRFLGHGLVMRVDQMHAQNPPSHPELLDWLARDLIAHEYDLRRLVTGIVSSQVYSRSSRWDQSAAPAPSLFAVANLRPLSPMQYGTSQLLASDPERLAAGAGPERAAQQLQKLESDAQGLYSRVIEVPQQGMVINVTEALKLSNDPVMLRLLGEKLVPALMKLDDRKKQIDLAVWTVLSRAPSEEEVAVLGDYLARRQERPERALRQVVWALLNGSEFRFNH